jgi:hypothetical protein
MMEAILSSEMPVLTKATRRNIPELGKPISNTIVLRKGMDDVLGPWVQQEQGENDCHKGGLEMDIRNPTISVRKGFKTSNNISRHRVSF